MNFDEQLKRAVDTLGDRLRDDISRELRLLADDLAGAAKTDRDAAVRLAEEAATQKAEAAARVRADQAAADAAHTAAAAAHDAIEAARAEHAAPSATSSPSTAATSHADSDDGEIVERLVTAFRAMDRARSLSEVLDALLDSASREAERAGVLLVRGGRVRGWRFAGFPPSFDGAGIDIGLDESGILTQAIQHRRAASSDVDGQAPPFAALGEHADSTEAIAIPMTVAGEVVAVLYVDQRDSEPGILTLEPATLEVLARHAASALEALTAFKAVHAVTPPLGDAALLPKASVS